MPTLNNWFVVPGCSDPYLAPELQKSRLFGYVEGHPELPDGYQIVTSVIDRIEDGKVVTRSGTHYELLDPDPSYEAEFPNAKTRVLGQAELGPNNLLRSKIDGVHCIGHDGMCDLIIGDFS